MSDLVAELDVTLEQIHSSEIVLVGHSFGAAIVLELLRLHPHRASRAVLVCPVYDATFQIASEQIFPDRNGEIGARVVDPSASAAEQYRSDTLRLAPLYFASESRAAGLRLLANCAYDGDLAKRIFDCYLPSFKLRPVLATLGIPTLIIAGQQDARVPSSYVRTALDSNPSFIFREISSAGHFPFLEQPEAVLRAVQMFLEESRSGITTIRE